MTYLTSWEDFAKAAERLYLADPMKALKENERPLDFIDHFANFMASKLQELPKEKVPDLQAKIFRIINETEIENCIKIVRFIMKYRHCDGKLVVKITDDQVCLQYLTEHAQDVKKIEKLTSLLMRHMASKEK